MFKPTVLPQPIGKVTVTTSGTPVSLATALITAGIASAGDPVAVNKIDVTANASNTGSCYLGSATMNRSTLAGVLRVITPGVGWSITTNVGLNTYQLQNLFVDADNSGDWVYGACDQV